MVFNLPAGSQTQAPLQLKRRSIMKAEDWDRQGKSMHFDLVYEGIPLCDLYIDPTGYDSETLSPEDWEKLVKNFAAEILNTVNSKTAGESKKMTG